MDQGESMEMMEPNAVSVAGQGLLFATADHGGALVYLHGVAV